MPTMWYKILILFISAQGAIAPHTKVPPSAAPQSTSRAKSATPSKIIAPPLSRKSTGAPTTPRGKSGSRIQMTPHTVVGEFIPIEFREDVYKKVKENSKVSDELVGGILSNALSVAGGVAATALGVDECMRIINTGSELVYHKNGKDWKIDLATFLLKATLGVTVGAQALTCWRLMGMLYDGVGKIPEIFPENFVLTREQQGKVFETKYQEGLKELMEKKRVGKIEAIKKEDIVYVFLKAYKASFGKDDPKRKKFGEHGIEMKSMPKSNPAVKAE